MKFIRYWAPAFCWMLLIFFLSSRQKVAVSDSYVVSFVIFKSLHLIEYAILYVLVFRAAKNTLKTKHMRTVYAFAFIVTALYALSDEIHQKFIPTREGRLRDAIIDMFGAAISWGIVQRWLPQAPKRLKTWAKKLQIL